MKVCMVAPVPPPYGGIANWVSLMDEYVEQIEDISFIHVNTAPKSRSTEGRGLWDRVVVQGFLMFKKNRELKRVLKRDKVDAIHMTTSAQLSIIRDIMLLKTAKKKGIPTVYHLRFGRTPEIAKANTREWKMLHKAMRLASCVVAIDNSTLGAIHKYAPEVTACYIPNPFDLRKIEKIEILPIEEQRKEIVFVGWVIKTKGVEELLEAWQEAKISCPDWKLRIVGPYNEEYFKELSSRFSFENVIFDGEKMHDETMKILAAAKAFILPSYTEGFPNSVLEAMALQKPIIATDVGAIPDMLEGGCGIVIPAKDATAIKTALKDLMLDENLRRSLSDRAKERLDRDYTMETVFEKYRKRWESAKEV